MSESRTLDLVRPYRLQGRGTTCADAAAAAMAFPTWNATGHPPRAASCPTVITSCSCTCSYLSRRLVSLATWSSLMSAVTCTPPSSSLRSSNSVMSLARSLSALAVTHCGSGPAATRRATSVRSSSNLASCWCVYCMRPCSLAVSVRSVAALAACALMAGRPPALATMGVGRAAAAVSSSSPPGTIGLTSRSPGPQCSHTATAGAAPASRDTSLTSSDLLAPACQ
mmetsp:Transcript_9889/g.24712  ORF Transcript_9889/g.24712 Transcript_9889/m.24712 type:complete len:225 (+) Transcript_9889:1093-1767(+)